MKKLHLALVIAIVVMVGLNAYFMLQNGNEEFYFPGYKDDIKKVEGVKGGENIIKISNECLVDFDCTWRITNCCTENAGGSWECISKTSQIECNDLVLCPQVLSPKPELKCSCVEKRCEAG